MRREPDLRPICVEHLYVVVRRGPVWRRQVYIECTECPYSFLVGLARTGNRRNR